MKVIITGFQGGCSKSATVSNLATFLSERDKVLQVNGDSNRTAFRWSQRGSLPYRVADARQNVE